MNSCPAKSLPGAFDGGTGEIAYLFIKLSSIFAGLVYDELSLNSYFRSKLLRLDPFPICFEVNFPKVASTCRSSLSFELCKKSANIVLPFITTSFPVGFFSFAFLPNALTIPCSVPLPLDVPSEDMV